MFSSLYIQTTCRIFLYFKEGTRMHTCIVYVSMCVSYARLLSLRRMSARNQSSASSCTIIVPNQCQSLRAISLLLMWYCPVCLQRARRLFGSELHDQVHQNLNEISDHDEDAMEDRKSLSGSDFSDFEPDDDSSDSGVALVNLWGSIWGKSGSDLKNLKIVLRPEMDSPHQMNRGCQSKFFQIRLRNTISIFRLLVTGDSDWIPVTKSCQISWQKNGREKKNDMEKWTKLLTCLAKMTQNVSENSFLASKWPCRG